jgi:hypothetical protein
MEPSNLALLTPIVALIVFVTIGLLKYGKMSSKEIEKICEEQKRNL